MGTIAGTFSKSANVPNMLAFLKYYCVLPHHVRMHKHYAFQFISDAETCKDIVNDVFEKTWNLYIRRADLFHGRYPAGLYQRKENPIDGRSKTTGGEEHKECGTDYQSGRGI